MPPQIFLCLCDCCGEGCGEIKCLLCLENCDFHSYVLKPGSCLEKNSAGEFVLVYTHEYYYHVQQQLFTTKLNYSYFVVCGVNENQIKLVSQNIFPDKDHLGTEFYLNCTNFGEFVSCLRYLLDGTQEERRLL